MHLRASSPLTGRPTNRLRRALQWPWLLLADVAVLAVTCIVVCRVIEGQWFSSNAVIMSATVAPIYALLVALDRLIFRRRAFEPAGLNSRLLAVMVASASICAIFYLPAGHLVSFPVEAALLAAIGYFAAIFVAGSRLRRATAGPFGLLGWSTLVVMDGGPSFDIPSVRVFHARDFDAEGAWADPAALGLLGQQMLGIDRVVVSCPTEKRSAWSQLLRHIGVRGEIVSNPGDDAGSSPTGWHGDQSFEVVSHHPLTLESQFTKRTIDLAVSVLLLLLLSPLMAIVAVAIKLEDGGPVLFVQRRVGQYNRVFEMLKFRSMDPARSDQDGEYSTLRNDERLTRVGKFIRRTSIDELPQLINVLRSEMSLIGPRPHALGSRAAGRFLWEVDDAYWQRHSLKPGLTGLAQVRGYRGAIETEDDLALRLGADIEYIRGWSLMNDFRILLSTVRVLTHTNAY